MNVNSIKERLGVVPVADPVPGRRGRSLPGSRRPHHDEGGDLRRGVEGPEVHVGRDPRGHQGQVRRLPRADDRGVRRRRRRDHGEVHGRQGRPDHRGASSSRRSGRAARRFKFFPVVCGSAFKNKGVQLLLDAVVNYLPSPIDIPPVKGVNPDKADKEDERKADDNEPFSALRVQDHQRSARQPDLLPRLLGQDQRAARWS